MNMQNIMAQAKKIQGEIERITKEIESTEYEFKNDSIHVVATGNNKIKKIVILKNEIIEDQELMEDIICVGVNDVLGQIKKDKDEKLGKYTGGLGGIL